jgi:hypothetical protein
LTEEGREIGGIILCKLTLAGWQADYGGGSFRRYNLVVSREILPPLLFKQQKGRGGRRRKGGKGEVKR